MVRSLMLGMSAICLLSRPDDKRKDLALAKRQAFVASALLPLLPLDFPRRGTPG
jgi:hypothetical protein